MEQKTFQVNLKLLENYLFEIDFGEFGTFMTDEPEPLGKGDGPGPSALLGASVANCLAASLLYSVRKFKSDPGDVSASCEGTLERVERRWRIVNLAVSIRMGEAAEEIGNLERPLEIFEDYCVVTQSVRHGIPVSVTVRDANGEVVKQQPAH